MNRKQTVWTITSEGRKKSFTTKKALDDFVKKNRPANDDHFVIEKVITESVTYHVKSAFDKVIVKPELMLDVVHYLGECLMNKNFGYSLNYDWLQNFDYEKYEKRQKKSGNTKYLSKQEYFGNKLKNATLENIHPDFRFNKCDLKGCNNYNIKFSSSDWIEFSKRVDLIPRDKNWSKKFDELKEEFDDKETTHFSIQFRTEQEKPKWDIVLGGSDCWGRHTHCVVSNKVPFDEPEKERFISFINSICI